MDRARGEGHPPHGPAAGLAREADRRGRGLVTGRLRRGRNGRVAVRARIGEPAPAEREEGPRSAPRARARSDGDALRPERPPGPDPRRSRPSLRRYPRANPPDREQHAEEARGVAGGAPPPRRFVTPRAPRSPAGP